jgi:hypothetical protein
MWLLRYSKGGLDLSVGHCSHGGTGFVKDITGEGPQRTFTVKYDTVPKESGIKYWRVTDTATVPRAWFLRGMYLVEWKD